MGLAVGQLIRNARHAKKMTQSALGLVTEISKTRISNIESGAVKATPQEIAAIARHFHSFAIIQAYWVESPLYDSLVYICGKLDMRVETDNLETTIIQFANDIIDCATRITQSCQSMSVEHVDRHEHIVLIGNELERIDHFIVALRLLICDTKR